MLIGMSVWGHLAPALPRSDPALGAGFNSANLRVRLLVTPHTTWVPGAAPTGNLHGTIRTLDRVGSAVTLACAPVVDAMTYMTVRGACAEEGGRWRRAAPRTPPAAAAALRGGLREPRWLGARRRHAAPAL